MATKPKTNVEALAGDESSVEIPEYDLVEEVDTPKKAATSPQEVVVSVDDVAASKRRQDAQAMKIMINNMKKMMKESPKIKFKPSPGYASIFGKDFTFLLNGFPIYVRFDGSEQEFPEPIYWRLRQKMDEGMEANAPKDVNRKIR